MRVEPAEIAAIKAVAPDAFAPDAVVRLFGRRGLLDVDERQDRSRDESRFLDHLFRRIDERQVDIVFALRDPAPALPARPPRRHPPTSRSRRVTR